MATQSTDSSTNEHPAPPSIGSLLQVPSEMLPSPQLSKRVVLNVGGVRHEVMWKTLDRLPHTRLGKLRYCTTHEALMELCDDYNFAEMEFFFDRQSRSFSSILNFYQTGRFHLPEDVCVLSFKEDIDYWNIDELYLESCCQSKYHQSKDRVLEEMRKDAKSVVEDFGTTSYCVKWRQKLWDLLEKPHTSIPALLLTIVSIVFIIVSAISIMLNTIPTFIEYLVINEGINETIVPQLTENKYLAIINAVCIAWFTLECVLRFWASPSKLSFFKDATNIIDLLANISFYISLMLSPPTYSTQGFNDFLRFLQITRVVRLVKLARYSTAVKSMGYTLRRSWKELGLFVMFLVIEVIVFSSLVYFVEKDAPNFISIPDAFWWAVVTMTTVGYGDMIPVTIWGKLVGAACCICGVLFIVLPIPILVNNFTECYREQIRREKTLKRLEVLKLANTSGNMVCLSPVNAQDVNLGSDGEGAGGGKDPAAVQITSSPLFQATGQDQEQEQPQLQSIKAISSS